MKERLDEEVELEIGESEEVTLDYAEEARDRKAGWSDYRVTVKNANPFPVRFELEFPTGRDLRFTRREVREATGWGDTQLKLHLSRLESLEYLLVRRDGARFVYELLWAGEGDVDQSAPFVMGLIDVENLKRQHYDAERSGVAADQSASGRGTVGGWPGLGRAAETPRNGAIVPFMPAAAIPTPESTFLDGAGPARSYA
jgi:hypothetical protein